MSRIFISYRRDDSAGHAGRLYDRLSQHFGDDNIFMDIDTIEPGLDFVEVIEEAVGSCDVLIALIGPRWLTATDAAGRRRLDKPEDWVRLEIATALDRNIRVIPVLVQDATMPRSLDLPAELKMLARRNALEIGDRFHPDVDRLIEVIEHVLGISVPAPATPKIKKPAPTPAPTTQPRSSNWLLFGGIGGCLLLVIIIGSLIFSAMGGRDDEQTPSLAERVYIPTSMPSPTNTHEPSTNTPLPPTHTPTLVPTSTDTPAPTGAPTAAPTPHPTTLPRLQPLEPEMILIPAGEFLMGSDPNKDEHAEDDEQPQHTLYLPDYYIAKTEVTNAQYAAFVQATGYQTEAEKAGSSWVFNKDEAWKEVEGANWQHPTGPSSNISQKSDYPVVHVSWHDAVAYSKWLSEATGRHYRLPTEAEWEKAARGTDGRIYPWGNTFDGNRLNFCDTKCEQNWANKDFDDGYAGTAPVGSYPNGASPYEVYDMAGNVSEWCATRIGGDGEDLEYKPYPYDTTEDEWTEDYLQGDDARVLRGGSWHDDPVFARCSYRLRKNPLHRSYQDGFRVACHVTP